MVLVWNIHFRGGLAWESSNKSLIFNHSNITTRAILPIYIVYFPGSELGLSFSMAFRYLPIYTRISSIFSEHDLILF
ncbi:hypothetical protein F0562_026604 [Nyssa sinensis]|uniref:Uncharacterized protein n=1 Tax=Nyssa sinensis TaxID=561372 RepID=A0A5J5BDE3_9ASTE|nr:hypothetical protein F0562_026604 [Nyssa sinensis]